MSSSSGDWTNSSVDACKDLLATLGYGITPPGQGSARRSLCEGLRGLYSIGGHLGGLFLILFASLLGVALPLLTKYVECLRSNPYAFTIGKTAATGVLLSVSTIHLINEGIAALDEPCIPSWLATYEAFAFLFALCAVLFMQALDLELADVAERWVRKQREHDSEDTEVTIHNNGSDDDGATTSVPSAPTRLRLEDRSTNNRSVSSNGVRGEESEGARACDDCSDEVPVSALSRRGEDYLSSQNFPKKEADTAEAHHHEAAHHVHAHGSGEGERECHGHQHLVVLPPAELGSVRQVIAAICMEFGVALHSIFVGVAVGLTTDQELKPLLIALFFHQAFEGMAMGSRIVDASFHGKLEVVLALVFALSAPAGMGVAIAVVSVSRDAMSGGKFVATMGILDAFCGGILLYLAFTLLLLDFPADVRRYCGADQPNSKRKKVGLFVALWFGMLLMAAVGNWL